MATVDTEAVKQANPIEMVVAETEQLVGTGRYRKGTQHDSLVVDTKGQAYFWNSMGADDQGDVITWVIKHRNCADFKDAIEWLCQRGNLPAPEWTGQDAQARVAARARDEALTVAARWMVRRLRACPAALDYAHSRGWTDETIASAGLGYSGDQADRKDLQGELAMHGHGVGDAIVKAVLKIPPGMLIYPHVRSGRVRYLSARSIEGKRHYNLDAELAGERQLYCNHMWAPTESRVVIVEGQADAVTLGQWGIAAIALAGVSVGDELLRAVQGHQTRYVGLDSDKAGLPAAMSLARVLGPLTRLVVWPAKDANEWLAAAPAPADVEQVLDGAQAFIERLCADAGQQPNATRMDAIKDAFRVIAGLEQAYIVQMQKPLSKLLRLDQREFKAGLAVAQKELGKAADDDDEQIPPVETVGGFIGDHLLELVYDPGANATKLAVRLPDGEMAIRYQVTIDGTRYQPSPVTAMLTKGVVLFPSDLGPALIPLELIRRIQTFIHKYLDLPSIFEQIASYYVLFTWVYDCFGTVPYLRVLGDSGTGKSRFLDTIGRICYRPILTMGATTTSPIFHLLDRYKGTLVLDEADYAQSDTTADIIKLINVGFSRGTPLLRAGSDKNNFDPEAFSVYGPKILSTRKKFQDDATEKRCLTHPSGAPTTRADIPLHLETNFHAEALELRNMLLTHRLKYWKPEIKVDESLIDRKAVEPRLNQIILGPITMIDDADLRADINKLVRAYNADLIQDRSMTLSAKVLQALVEIMAGPKAGLKTNGEPYWDLSLKRVAVIVNRLMDEENETDEGEKPQGSDQASKSKPKKDVTSRSVGRICKSEFYLGLARTTWGTQSMGVEWDAERVEGLCKRYGVEWKTPGAGADQLVSAAAFAPVGSLV